MSTICVFDSAMTNQGVIHTMGEGALGKTIHPASLARVPSMPSEASTLERLELLRSESPSTGGAP